MIRALIVPFANSAVLPEASTIARARFEFLRRLSGVVSCRLPSSLRTAVGSGCPVRTPTAPPSSGLIFEQRRGARYLAGRRAKLRGDGRLDVDVADARANSTDDTGNDPRQSSGASAGDGKNAEPSGTQEYDNSDIIIDVKAESVTTSSFAVGDSFSGGFGIGGQDERPDGGGGRPGSRRRSVGRRDVRAVDADDAWQSDDAGQKEPKFWIEEEEENELKVRDALARLREAKAAQLPAQHSIAPTNGIQSSSSSALTTSPSAPLPETIPDPLSVMNDDVDERIIAVTNGNVRLAVGVWEATARRRQREAVHAARTQNARLEALQQVLIDEQRRLHDAAVQLLKLPSDSNPLTAPSVLQQLAPSSSEAPQLLVAAASRAIAAANAPQLFSKDTPNALSSPTAIPKDLQGIRSRLAVLHAAHALASSAHAHVGPGDHGVLTGVAAGLGVDVDALREQQSNASAAARRDAKRRKAAALDGDSDDMSGDAGMMGSFNDYPDSDIDGFGEDSLSDVDWSGSDREGASDDEANIWLDDKSRARGRAAGRGKENKQRSKLDRRIKKILDDDPWRGLAIPDWVLGPGAKERFQIPGDGYDALVAGSSTGSSAAQLPKDAADADDDAIDVVDVKQLPTRGGASTHKPGSAAAIAAAEADLLDPSKIPPEIKARQDALRRVRARSELMHAETLLLRAIGAQLQRVAGGQPQSAVGDGRAGGARNALGLMDRTSTSSAGTQDQSPRVDQAGSDDDDFEFDVIDTPSQLPSQQHVTQSSDAGAASNNVSIDGDQKAALQPQKPQSAIDRKREREAQIARIRAATKDLMSPAEARSLTMSLGYPVRNEDGKALVPKEGATEAVAAFRKSMRNPSKDEVERFAAQRAAFVEKLESEPDMQVRVKMLLEEVDREDRLRGEPDVGDLEDGAHSTAADMLVPGGSAGDASSSTALTVAGQDGTSLLTQPTNVVTAPSTTGGGSGAVVEARTSLIPPGYRSWGEVAMQHATNAKRMRKAKAALNAQNQQVLDAVIKAPRAPGESRQLTPRQVRIGSNIHACMSDVLASRAIPDADLYPAGLAVEIAECEIAPDMRSAYVRWRLPLPSIRADEDEGGHDGGSAADGAATASPSYASLLTRAVTSPGVGALASASARRSSKPVPYAMDSDLTASARLLLSDSLVRGETRADAYARAHRKPRRQDKYTRNRAEADPTSAFRTAGVGIPQVQAALDRHAGSLRRMVAQRLALRFVPSLQFHYYLAPKPKPVADDTYAEGTVAAGDAQSQMAGSSTECAGKFHGSGTKFRFDEAAEAVVKRAADGFETKRSRSGNRMEMR